MKKEFNKIVLFIGLLVTMVGFWLRSFGSTFVGLDFTLIVMICAFGFVLVTNTVLKTMGYCLSATFGAIGISNILKMTAANELSIGLLTMSIGMIVMSLAAVIYFVRFLLGYFGFVKKIDKQGNLNEDCLWKELSRYKELLEDGILTEEEFSELKQRAMDGADRESTSMDDLKKWKKLMDQQVIDAEEFSSIKKNIFAK